MRPPREIPFELTLRPEHNSAYSRMQAVSTDHEIELAPRRTFKSYGRAIRCVLDFKNAVAEDNFTSGFDCAVNYFSETAARQTDVASAGHLAENIDAKSSDASPATIYEAHLLHPIGAMVQVAKQPHLFCDVVTKAPEIDQVAALA